jgi:membrane protein
VFSRALDRYWYEDGDPMAGYIAYNALLSIFPFAIFTTSFSAWFVTPADVERAIDALFQLAPPNIAETLRPVVVDVATPRRGALITTSAVIALYIASNAVEAIRVAFDRAYKVPQERPWLRARLRALVFVVLSTFTFLALGALVIGAPLALAAAESWLGIETPYGVTLLRYVVALLIFALFLYQLHRVLPSHRPPRRRIWPGICVTLVLWVVAASGFSVYLLYTPYYSVTYGTLAGVIVTLFFFYITAAIILFGAEVNAVLMSYRRPRPSDED